mmetsp:Transcript_17452/g.35110  ORF Transcript_17452/g.35110 Transcript_17452/m.35110 type:complete len:137 (+) Transcript_17452:823-1233(+)
MSPLRADTSMAFRERKSGWLWSNWKPDKRQLTSQSGGTSVSVNPPVIVASSTSFDAKNFLAYSNGNKVSSRSNQQSKDGNPFQQRGRSSANDDETKQKRRTNKDKWVAKNQFPVAENRLKRRHVRSSAMILWPKIE